LTHGRPLNIRRKIDGGTNSVFSQNPDIIGDTNIN
jgi:hypothetical protein